MSDQVWLAWIGLAAGIFGPIALAVAGWIRSRSLDRKLNEVHTIVNQQRTDMMNEIRDLRERVTMAAEVARVLAEKAGPPKA
jgi:hypothetical protein